MPAEGAFIVVDGVDGAGKGTQITMLRDALLSRGRAAHVTAEPSTWPIGALIRRYLRSELPESLPGAASMALLFAADRMQHLEHEILPHLSRGEIVLCDRYDASSIAYQSATAAGDEAARDRMMAWVAELNARARRPDLTVVLDLPVELAAERRAARGAKAELFERLELQRRIRAQYAKLPRVRPDDSIVVVDASPSIDEVHETLLARVLARLATT